MKDIFIYGDNFVYGSDLIDNKIKKMSLFKYKQIKKFMPNKAIRVLEVGCGGGGYLRSLQRDFPKLKLYGCDLDSNAIEDSAKRSHSPIKFKVANILDLPYKDNYFDVVIAMDILEHVGDTQIALKEIRRVLKKEGIFHLFSPCEDNPLTINWFFRKIGLFRDMTRKFAGHVVYFSVSSLMDEIKKARFRIIRKRPSEYHIFQVFVFFFYLLFYFNRKNSLWHMTSVQYKAKDKQLFSRCIKIVFSKFISFVYWLGYHESVFFNHDLGAYGLSVTSIKK